MLTYTAAEWQDIVEKLADGGHYFSTGRQSQTLQPVINWIEFWTVGKDPAEQVTIEFDFHGLDPWDVALTIQHGAGYYALPA